MIIPYNKIFIPSFQNSKKNIQKQENRQIFYDYKTNKKETLKMSGLTKKEFNNIVDNKCIENSKQIKMGLDLII